MMGADILAEHALAQPLRQSDRDSFAAEGVSIRALTWSAFNDLSIVARDRVVFDGTRFEFERYARHDGAPFSSYTTPIFDECGDPVDLLAFRPNGPSATWLGRVAVAGAEQIWMPRRDLGEALDVHVDTLSWLRAGRVGIVIIDAQRAAEQLRGVTLRVADPVYARRLRNVLARPAPPILIAGNPGIKNGVANRTPCPIPGGRAA